MNLLPPLILFLPLAAALLITLFTKRNRLASAALSLGAVWGSFVLLLLLIGTQGWSPGQREFGWTWFEIGELSVGFGFTLDRLSFLMALIVTGVGGLIHIYSYGYMRDDPGFSRYFASLSLFTFSMLGIVLSNNFIQMFIFWELVGVSSYLLIGFWFDRAAAADAAKKAFITNRLGDFGFLLGILLIWGIAGSLDFAVLQAEFARNPELLGGLATAAGLLIFCGAVGKSAQFPLHVWLPDAMEGPTPVSALIHAATMVAAGVYMLCRVYFLLPAPALEIIAWVGALTALLAAVIAVQQDDIKRILAYSTLSQLGYMVMAVGVHGPAAAMYHLTTHAFFKALLFLGAGSVIHALHHEQNIWNMGGLRKKMPVTFWTFLLGTLALCGMPPLSGFYSKDEVLLRAYEMYPALFGVAVVVVVLTTFYMFRLVFVAFLGNARSESSVHAHESPAVLTVPLLILAVPSILAGFWGIETMYAAHFDGPGDGHGHSLYDYFVGPFAHAPAVAFLSLFALGFGLSCAIGVYGNAQRDPLPEAFGFFARTMRNRFYFDELYALVIRLTHDLLAKIADAVDRWVVAGFLVKGAHGTTELVGRALRLVQTGNLQTYSFWFVLGVVVLLYFALSQ